MKSPTKSNVPAYVFDLRVRERLLASGVLDPKALEKHLAELTDTEAASESLGVPQPALSGSAELDYDDDDDDDDDDDGEA